ncbi:NUDIX domain-containing protein [Streptomyces sp. SCA3-4]|uniref:NUDIX domain-containing protein n=1 Tax=Streptomyces sichuanensis TaxID=2871810 RepID=UPI001CE28B2D|nr:NUDIX domain-containing protein [Streptomyces sichuanensis]MCA6095855.1 NUDIX domain-containing protein [Streptomyces sichuanensis]
MTSQEPKGTAALIVNARGDYLLHLRDNIAGICDPGTWSFLGGNRDSDHETPEDAIARELKEEAGLVVPDLRRYTVVSLHGPDGRPGEATVFQGHWDGDVSELALTEGVMLHWFPAAMVPRLVMAPWAASVIDQHEREMGAVAAMKAFRSGKRSCVDQAWTTDRR